MIATEKQVRLAARMYEIRDTAKQLLGSKYAARMEVLKAAITSVAAAHGIDPVQVLVAAQKNEEMSPLDLIYWTAAVVEVTEGKNE